jgi:hypothetical protein
MPRFEGGMLSKIPPFRPRRDAHPDTEEEVRMSQIVESVKWPLNLKLIELKEVGFIERADLLKFIAGIHSDADGVTGAEIVRHLEAQHFFFS